VEQRLVQRGAVPQTVVARTAGRGGPGVVDVTVESVALAVAAVATVGHGLRAVAAPVADLVLRPPVLAPALQPATWLRGLAERGHGRRAQLVTQGEAVLDRLLPALLEEVVRRLDLTDLVRRYVDLDALVASVDLDAIAARLDIDRVAARLDLDAVALRLDVDAVARRLDVEAVLDGLDLTKVVRERVDLDALVAGVDVDAVIDRLDLRRLAEEVIAAVDLPEIIRQSTGSVTSETVRGARMRGISGDDALARTVDRLRRRHAQPVAPTTPELP
jgi:hypothetical protein